MKVIAEALLKYEQITVEEMEAIISRRNVKGGEHLRVEDDEDLNRKRLIKQKGIKPQDIPKEILQQNLVKKILLLFQPI